MSFRWLLIRNNGYGKLLASRFRRQVCLLIPLVVQAGCAIQAHDARLDQYRLRENLTPAESLAKGLAIKAYGCENMTARELSGKLAEGAPLGPVWRDYEIQVSGCGHSQTYLIQCEGDSTCFEKSP